MTDKNISRNRAIISAVLAGLATGYLLFAIRPVYHVMSAGTSTSQVSEELVTADWEVQGLGLILLLPTVIAAAAAMASFTSCGRIARVVAALLLAAFVIAGAASVGLPYAPAAMVMVFAVLADFRPASAKHKSIGKKSVGSDGV